MTGAAGARPDPGARSFRKDILFALLAGLAAALGHAPFGLWPLALLGFAGLIHLVARSPRPGRLVWAGGLGYFGMALHWIVEPFLVDIATHGWMAPFALAALAAGLALFWGLAGWSAARLGTGAGRRALAFVALLTAAELIRGHVFTGFPWALPAYIWAETPLRMLAALTGSYGLSFLTLLIAAAPSLIRSRALGGLGLVAGVALLFGLGTLTLRQPVPAPLGQVRLVQPNVPQAEKWDRAKAPGHFDRLIALTEGAGATDLVLWPEVALVYPLDLAGPALEEGHRAAGTALLTGINRRDAEGRFFNALVTLDDTGALAETYDKVHLVPFGEYIPFRIELLRAMAATSGFGFTPGVGVRLIDTPLGRALPLICYEGIFPGHVFRAGERADYLVLITNDAWFGNFSGPYQHLDQARFRAVEQGLSVVRVANTGVSTVIDPLGRMGAALPLNQAGALDQEVPGPLRATLYARTGDLPLLAVLAVLLTTLIIANPRNPIAKPAPRA
ncbi:MAG: apolipoprotein N-acyltransferase [Silicimonas sp.]|nr:apolipoprotein N-acyltransferase [Silicimonas sp.]